MADDTDLTPEARDWERYKDDVQASSRASVAALREVRAEEERLRQERNLAAKQARDARSLARTYEAAMASPRSAAGDPLEQRKDAVQAASRASLDALRQVRQERDAARAEARTETYKDDVQAASRASLDALRQVREQREAARARAAAIPVASMAPEAPTASLAFPPARPAAPSAAADARQQALDATLDVRRMREQAAYQATPEGRSMQAEQRRLEDEKRRAAAQVQEAAADPKTTFAKVMTPVERFAGGLAKVIPVVGQLQMAFDNTIGILTRFGGKASPAHAETLQGSMDLLMARAGQHLLPAMEDLSRQLQNLARAVPDPNSRLGSLLTQAAGLGAAETGRVLELFGMGGGELKHSLAGMPQAQISTGEQYFERLQLGAMNQDDIQTELLREQLKALERLIGRLDQPLRTGDQIVVPFR